MTRGATACVFALLVFGPIAQAQSTKSSAGNPAPGVEPTVARMVNASEVRRRLGLVPGYEGVASVAKIKIAILDFGFEGVGDDRPYLPRSAEVVERYDADFVRRFNLGDPAYHKGLQPLNRHGRVMAQIVWEVTGARPGGPKFYLLNANGPTMLRRAVRYAIEQKVDVILFSGTFEGGGNGDGRGPINRIVDDALAAGILWINSAGNYGRHVYSGPVSILSDGYLRLRAGSDIASLRFRNRIDENAVTVTLTWNDYRDEEDAGTDKDLDLFVEDWSGRRIGSSEKVQLAKDREPGPNETRNPRERVVLTDLPADPDVRTDPNYTYRIRVRRKRGQFVPTDRIRILLTASREYYVAPGSDSPREAVEFLDATGDEEVYPPADNPRVLTVGDSSPESSIGPTTDRRVKPDVIVADSRAYFSDGEVTAGSSDAAAYVAGVVAVLRAAEPALRPTHLLRLAALGPAVPASAARGRNNQPATIAPGFHYWRTPSRAQVVETLWGIR
jgi:hypothetical protein